MGAKLRESPERDFPLCSMVWAECRKTAIKTQVELFHLHYPVTVIRKKPETAKGFRIFIIAHYRGLFIIIVVVPENATGIATDTVTCIAAKFHLCISTCTSWRPGNHLLHGHGNYHHLWGHICLLHCSVLLTLLFNNVFLAILHIDATGRLLHLYASQRIDCTVIPLCYR